MNDAGDFADKQLEIATEFAQYIADPPEVDLVPEKSHICFQIEGETEFNRYSRDLAQRHQQEDGWPIVMVSLGRRVNYEANQH